MKFFFTAQAVALCVSYISRQFQQQRKWICKLISRRTLQGNILVLWSRDRMQTEKGRAYSLGWLKSASAFILNVKWNSSQMREVSYKKQGITYFAIKEYVVLTSYAGYKYHFASFCSFWVWDIKTKSLLAQSFSVYFLYLMENNLPLHLLHVTYRPFQSRLNILSQHTPEDTSPCTVPFWAVELSVTWWEGVVPQD